MKPVFGAIHEVMLGLPGRDEQIENWCKSLRNMGAPPASPSWATPSCPSASGAPLGIREEGAEPM